MFLGLYQIEILFRLHAIGHFCEVLQIGSCDLRVAMVLLHLQESLHFFIYDFHYVIRDVLTLQILQKLFDLILLLVRVLVKILFQLLINLLKLLLRLLMILLILVLPLQILPYF